MSECGNRRDVHAVASLTCAAGRSDDHECRWLALASSGDALGKSTQARYGCVDLTVAHLDLEGCPVSTRKSNDCVDFVASFVSPRVDAPAEHLKESLNAHSGPFPPRGERPPPIAASYLVS